MAVKAQELYDEYQIKLAQVLNDEEIALIDTVEKDIDDVLRREYKGKPVNVPIHKLRNIKSIRNEMMINELKKRFIEAGWIYKSQSSYGPDFVTLEVNEELLKKDE